VNDIRPVELHAEGGKGGSSLLVSCSSKKMDMRFWGSSYNNQLAIYEKMLHRKL
jgi:hypothetical protein